MSKTILVVEDDKSIQRLLQDALSELGHTVVCEKDGDWALKTFDKRPVDLVILDILVPVLNGFQVAEKIRERPRGKNVPIIMISGIYRGARHRQEAAEKWGVSDYLDKPLQLPVLIGAVQKHLGTAPAPAAPTPRTTDVTTASPPPLKKAETRLVDDEGRQEKKEVERLARAGFAGAQVARGNLAATPFPEVLAQLYRWRSTGALLLRRDQVKKIVYLKDGYTISVKSNLLQECLGKIMVRERMISEADCEVSIKKMKATGRQQGTILIEMGSISPHNLVYALQVQLESKLYDVFDWEDGDYQFNPKGEIPPSTVQLDHTPANIIMEGVKRTWSVARLTAQLSKHLDTEVSPHPDPLQRLQDLDLNPKEELFTRLIDGKRTLNELLNKSPLPREDTLRLAYGLIAAQVVQVGAGMQGGETTVSPPPAQSTRPEDAATRAVHVPQMVPPPLRKGPLPRPPAAPAAVPPAPVPAPVSLTPRPVTGEDRTAVGTPPLAPVDKGAREDREHVERLSKRVKEMRKMNYFEMLGISKNASIEEVKKAYFSQAKDYHPDKHFGTQSAEVKALADQIYSMLSTAYEVLSDPRDREDYVRGLTTGVKSGVSDEVSRILAAEGKFQKGEAFMRKKDWSRAQECFKAAVDLYPDEGEFHSYLGWALYQTNPSDAELARQAEKHIEHGLQLNPKIDKSYLFLGWLYKGTGRKELSEKQFEKAIQCNPDCTDALRELRLITAQRDGAAKRKAN
ncbi:MAG: response regulator [Myxococcota bacterium]